MLEGLKLRIRRWRLEREYRVVVQMHECDPTWEARFEGCFEEHEQLCMEEQALARRRHPETWAAKRWSDPIPAKSDAIDHEIAEADQAREAYNASEEFGLIRDEDGTPVGWQ